MVNHYYGHQGKIKRKELNDQREDMGIDKFEGLLPEWQAKTTYYNHIPKFHVGGKSFIPCGTEYPNQPSDAGTQQRRGSIDIFPIEWDGKCRLEAKGEKCICNPKAEKVKEEVKVENKTSI